MPNNSGHQKQLVELFTATLGAPPSRIQSLSGDGSDRQIFRLFLDDKSWIGICSDHAAENRAFIEFSRHFQSYGLNTPRIIATDKNLTCYIEQDLGDVTLETWLRTKHVSKASSSPLLNEIIRTLPHFQIGAGRSIDFSLCYQYDRFQQDSMWFDVQYFLNRFADGFAGRPFSRANIETELQVLINHCLDAPADFFLYRDFQSRNIMIVENEPWFIDYQSGRRGALQYDVASLLFDPYIRLAPDMGESLLADYFKEVEKLLSFSPKEFMTYYYEFALLRMLQALGAYGNLGVIQGKTHFLKSIPPALQNVKYLLQTSRVCDDLIELKRLFLDDLLLNPDLQSPAGIRHLIEKMRTQ